MSSSMLPWSSSSSRSNSLCTVLSFQGTYYRPVVDNDSLIHRMLRRRHLFECAGISHLDHYQNLTCSQCTGQSALARLLQNRGRGRGKEREKGGGKRWRKWEWKNEGLAAMPLLVGHSCQGWCTYGRVCISASVCCTLVPWEWKHGSTKKPYNLNAQTRNRLLAQKTVLTSFNMASMLPVDRARPERLVQGYPEASISDFSFICRLSRNKKTSIEEPTGSRRQARHTHARLVARLGR